MNNKRMLLLCLSIFIISVSWSNKIDSIETKVVQTNLDSSIISDTLNRIINETNPIIINNNFPKKAENYFTEIIPILTLLLGFFMGKIYDYFIGKKEILKNGRIWIETFLQLEEPLEKQIKNITSFVDENSKNKYKIGKINSMISLDCNQFKSLKEDAIIPFLMKKYKLNYKESIKLTGKIKNTVRVIEGIDKKFHSSIRELTETTNPISDKFKIEFVNYRKLMNAYIEELFQLRGKTPEIIRIEKEIIRLSDKYIHEPSKNNTFNPFEISDKFVPEINKVIFTERNKPKLKLAMDALYKCDQTIADIRVHRKYFISRMNFNIEANKNSFKNIQEISTNLE